MTWAIKTPNKHLKYNTKILRGYCAPRALSQVAALDLTFHLRGLGTWV